MVHIVLCHRPSAELVSDGIIARLGHDLTCTQYHDGEERYYHCWHRGDGSSEFWYQVTAPYVNSTKEETYGTTR